MGRLSAFLFLIAACGDNMAGLEAPDPLHAALDPSGLLTEQPTARLTPTVCGVAEWSVPAGADRSLDMSVASAHGIASIVAVPQAGGAMTGFSFDSRMDVVTDPLATKLPIDGTLSKVSASMVDDRLLTATADGNAVRVHLFDEFLQNPQQLAKLDATTFSKPAFMTANSTPVIVTGGVNGLSMTSFSANFEIGETKLIAPSAPVTALATAQYGGAVLAAWSTSSNDCYVADVASFVSGSASHTNMPCAHPRLAGDIANNAASLVFEQDGTLRLMHISHLQMGGVSSLLRPDAHSPRIVFDGARYWVSYIDARGGIVVGFLDHGSHFTSMALIGPAPADEAYELALVEGRVTVVALDVQGNYTAHQMCAVAAAE
ncbi:hypothetical protein BH11MYX1_BH11MYX1_26230 [soil metagenome]